MWKPIHNTAALATIAATGIAVLAYWWPRQAPSADERRERAAKIISEDTSVAGHELRQALSAALRISSPNTRDLALQHVVRAGLTADKDAVAIEAADSILSPGMRDEVLNYIAGLSIARHQFANAQRAAGLISSPSMHDDALQRVAEAINARYSPSAKRGGLTKR